ncbi:MAG: tetratricopeptide repeat protein [Lacibacter sp.]
MQALQQQLKQAFEWRRKGQWQQALEIYTPLWQAHPETFSGWDGWSYAHCLQQQKQYEAALQVCRTLYPHHKTLEPLRQTYAWCIYYTTFRAPAIAEVSDAVATKALQAVWHLAPPQQPHSPAHRCLFAYVKQLAARMQPPWQQIWNLLQQTAPANLSKQPYTLQVPGNKNNTELASDLEEWYSWCSKALLQLGHWQQCIDLCNQALQAIEKWHYSNQVWFLRRKAAALVQLGETEKALPLLDALLAQKPEWFLLADRAAATPRPAEALAWYARASLQPAEPHMKINMWQKMAQLLQQTGQTEAARQHAQLCHAIRRQQGWPPQPIPGLPDVETEADTPGLTVPELLQQLRPFWNSCLPPHLQLQKGTISKVLHGGASGFITNRATGQSIYFSRRHYAKKTPPPTEGMAVQFYVQETRHPKTGRPATQAVQVQPEKN